MLSYYYQVQIWQYWLSLANLTKFGHMKQIWTFRSNLCNCGWSRYQNLVQAGFLILLRIQKTNKTFSPADTKSLVDNVGQFWPPWPNLAKIFKFRRFKEYLCMTDQPQLQRLAWLEMSKFVSCGQIWSDWPKIANIIIFGLGSSREAC